MTAIEIIENHLEIEKNHKEWAENNIKTKEMDDNLIIGYSTQIKTSRCIINKLEHIVKQINEQKK